MEIFINECKILSSIDQENIIPIISLSLNGIYKKKDGKILLTKTILAQNLGDLSSFSYKYCIKIRKFSNVGRTNQIGTK